MEREFRHIFDELTLSYLSTIIQRSQLEMQLTEWAGNSKIVRKIESVLNSVDHVQTGIKRDFQSALILSRQ